MRSSLFRNDVILLETMKGKYYHIDMVTNVTIFRDDIYIKCLHGDCKWLLDIDIKLIGNEYSHSSRNVFRTTRINADPNINNHGRSLLHLCRNSGLQIWMDGRGPDGYKMGNYTCINSQDNASMTDYLITCVTGASLISYLNVETMRAESDHIPLIFMCSSVWKTNQAAKMIMHR